jgi:hypothetical protein
MRRGLALLIAGAALLGGCRNGRAATRARGAGDGSMPPRAGANQADLPSTSGHRSSAASCQWTDEATVLHQAGDTLYQVWSLAPSATETGWRQADMPALTDFRRAVEARLKAVNIPTDPAGLLRRQVGYYAARADSASRHEAENGRLVLDGAAGTMRPLSCVEALLLDFQARRFPMIQQPTEFHAFVLRRNGPVGDSTRPSRHRQQARRCSSTSRPAARRGRPASGVWCRCWR